MAIKSAVALSEIAGELTNATPLVNLLSAHLEALSLREDALHEGTGESVDAPVGVDRRRVDDVLVLARQSRRVTAKVGRLLVVLLLLLALKLVQELLSRPLLNSGVFSRSRRRRRELIVGGRRWSRNAVSLGSRSKRRIRLVRLLVVRIGKEDVHGHRSCRLRSSKSKVRKLGSSRVDRRLSSERRSAE